MAVKPPLRILHTSDLHLGDGDGDSPSVLAVVVDLALELRVDAVLIAGDLFDHNRISDLEVTAFQSQVARLAQPVVVLPGNHDCYDGSSVYRRPSFNANPANLYLLTEANDRPLSLPGLKLEVWGRPTVEHHSGFRPLQGVPARQSDGWYVVLAHGHLVESSEASYFSAPITPEEIADSPGDYVALGHWGGFRDVSQGPVRAAYSGSPCPRGPSRQGTIAVVELSDQGATLEQLMVSLR